MAGRIERKVRNKINTIAADTDTEVAAILAAVDTEIASILEDTGTTIPGTITTLQGNVTSILEDTGTTIPAQISALNNITTAQVNTEVDTALNTIVPASPTAGSLNDILSKAAGGNTFNKATDSLEAIRDIIDTYNTADQVDLDAILEDTGTTIPATIAALQKVADHIKARKGNTWYVDSSVGSSGAGTSWATAFKTITEAHTAAASGDTIIITGEYDEGAAVTITKELTFKGQNPSSNGYPTMIYNSADHQLFIIKASNVRIENIGFVQTQANIAVQIGDTAGQAYYKIYIDGCKFDLYGTGTYAIASGDTADAPDIHIQNCLFRSFATAAIQGNWTRAKINNNEFLVPTAKTGIVHTPNAGDRPDTRILDNKFVTTDSTDGVGITVTNTPSAGMLMVDGNHFVNFADDNHRISKRTGYTGLNYGGVTAVAIT